MPFLFVRVMQLAQAVLFDRQLNCQILKAHIVTLPFSNERVESGMQSNVRSQTEANQSAFTLLLRLKVASEPPRP